MPFAWLVQATLAGTTPCTSLHAGAWAHATATRFVFAICARAFNFSFFVFSFFFFFVLFFRIFFCFVLLCFVLFCIVLCAFVVGPTLVE